MEFIPSFDAICLFDTNQKVKLYIMDDMEAVNLLSHIFRAHMERINRLFRLRHNREPGSDISACWSQLQTAWDTNSKFSLIHTAVP